MLPPLFPGHRVPPKQILHHRLEMLPEGKLLLCSPCACFLFVWVYEANPSTDPASDMTAPKPERKGHGENRQGCPPWGKLGAVHRHPWWDPGCWSTEYVSLTSSRGTFKRDPSLPGPVPVQQG